MGLARRLIRQPGSSSSPPHPGAQGPPHPGAPSSPPREHLLPTREYPPPWRGAPSPRSGSCSSRGGEVALPGGELRLPGGEVALPGGELRLPGGEAGLQGGEAALPGGEAALPGREAALPGWGERLSRVGSSVLPGGERCSPHPGSTLLRVGRGPKTREFRLPGRANRGELLPGFWPPPGVGRALSRGWGEGRIFEVRQVERVSTESDTWHWHWNAKSLYVAPPPQHSVRATRTHIWNLKNYGKICELRDKAPSRPGGARDGRAGRRRRIAARVSASGVGVSFGSTRVEWGVASTANLASWARGARGKTWALYFSKRSALSYTFKLIRAPRVPVQ